MHLSLLCCMGHNINATSSSNPNPNSKEAGSLGSVLLHKHRSSVATLALSWTQYKSCVFIHRDVVLTTHQNLPDPERADLAEVAFCVYHHNAKPGSPLKTTITRRLQPSRLFITDAALDLTVVACEPSHNHQNYTVPCLSLPRNGRSVASIDVGQHVYVVGQLDDIYNRGIATSGYGTIASLDGEKRHILQIVSGDSLGSLWTPGSAGFDEQGEFCFIVTDPKCLENKSSDHLVQYGVSMRVVKDWLLSHGIRDLEDLNHHRSQDYRLVNGLSDAKLFELNSSQNLNVSMVFKNEIYAIPELEAVSSRKLSLHSNSNSSFSSLFEIDISQDMRLLPSASSSTQLTSSNLGVTANKGPGSQKNINISTSDKTPEKGLDFGIGETSSASKETIPTTDSNNKLPDQQASDSVFWEINLLDDTIASVKNDKVDSNCQSFNDNSIDVDMNMAFRDNSMNINSTLCLNSGHPNLQKDKFITGDLKTSDQQLNDIIQRLNKLSIMDPSTQEHLSKKEESVSSKIQTFSNFRPVGVFTDKRSNNYTEQDTSIRYESAGADLISLDLSHKDCRFQGHSFRLAPIDSTLGPAMETIRLPNVVDSVKTYFSAVTEKNEVDDSMAQVKTLIEEPGFVEIALRTPRLSIDNSANTSDMKQPIHSSTNITNETKSVNTSVNSTNPKHSTDSSVVGEANSLQVPKKKSLSPEEISKRIQGYGNVSMIDIVRRKSDQGKLSDEHTDQSLKNILLDVRTTIVGGLWTKPAKGTSPDPNQSNY